MSTTSYESTRQALARRTGENLAQKLSGASSGWSRAERRIAINFIKALATGENLEESLMRQSPSIWLGAGDTLLAHCTDSDAVITRLPSDKVRLVYDIFATISAESLDPADASF